VTATPFDPVELADLADPHPRYDEVRGDGGPVELATGGLGVFGYDAAVMVLRDPRFCSAPLGRIYAATLPPGALADEMGHRINFLDPPDHPRVRGLVSQAFTPRRVRALRPWIEATAASLVDELVVADGEVEVMRGLAHPLPSLVISELLGVPTGERERLTDLADTVSPVLGTRITPEQRAAAVAAADELHAVRRAEIDARRTDPRDDLLSALVAAEEDGARLSPPELMSLAATLYSAGHRTTRDLFGNGLDLVLGRGIPVPATVGPEWVDEIARLATPTHFVARFAAEDVDVAGRTLPAGTPLMVFLAAANRDPARYARPHDFDATRAGPPALSFANGPHFCLGAGLARLEVQAMVEAVHRRFPDAGPVGTASPWHQRGPFRGLDRLPLRVA
jgi:cytochrome P450